MRHATNVANARLRHVPAVTVAAQESAGIATIAGYSVAATVNREVAQRQPLVTGILYQNASGTISQVAAQNHVLTPDLIGCQSGFGLRIESTDTAPKVATVNLQNNSVRDYQKNGITALEAPTPRFRSSAMLCAGKHPPLAQLRTGFRWAPVQPALLRAMM